MEIQISKIIRLSLLTLLILYTIKLYRENSDLKRNLKKLGKSTNKANTNNYLKIQNITSELETVKMRYDSLVILNAISISASVRTLEGYNSKKCTFENVDMRKAEILNTFHDNGEYEKIYNIARIFRLDPLEGTIPFYKLLRLFSWLENVN